MWISKKKVKACVDNEIKFYFDAPNESGDLDEENGMD